jgi:hypothetical protein
MTASHTPTTKLQGHGAPVLYLDFDGVLHPEDVWRHPVKGIYLGLGGAGHQLFENVQLLQDLLAPYPQVSIVLSTSWVRVLRFSAAKSHLPPGLASRVVGATFHSQMDDAAWSDLPRGKQVERDVARRQPSAWVAIDDTDEGWSGSAGSHLVLTDPVDGIRNADVLARLQAVLSANFGNPA